LSISKTQILVASPYTDNVVVTLTTKGEQKLPQTS